MPGHNHDGRIGILQAVSILVGGEEVVRVENGGAEAIGSCRVHEEPVLARDLVQPFILGVTARLTSTVTSRLCLQRDAAGEGGADNRGHASANLRQKRSTGQRRPTHMFLAFLTYMCLAPLRGPAATT